MWLNEKISFKMESKEILLSGEKHTTEKNKMLLYNSIHLRELKPSLTETFEH